MLGKDERGGWFVSGYGGRLRLKMQKIHRVNLVRLNLLISREIIERHYYQRFDCLSYMHKFGVKVQQFMWTETSAEIMVLYFTVIVDVGLGRLFFCSVHVLQTSPNARGSFAGQNSASAMMLTSRCLRVEA